MRRRPVLRRRVNTVASALEAHGLRPCAIDILSTGTVRFHLTPPIAGGDEADLDRELADFEARHDQR